MDCFSYSVLGGHFNMKIPTLETERLLIRPLDYKDIDDVFLLFSNPNVMKYDSGYVITDKQDAKAYIDMSMHQNQDGFAWAIEEKKSGSFVGTGGLKNWYGSHFAEVGLILDERYWNQKFGSEAVHKIVEFAFQTLRLSFVYATTLPENKRSIRLLERLGFQFYGWTNDYWFANRYVNGLVFIKSVNQA